MKIYCSGIGGIGLSAYAAVQNAAGHSVTGSDRSDSPLLDDLRSQGISIVLNQDGSGVQEGMDLFVYSEAVPEDAPERKKARELNIRSISYFHALGELTKDFFVIAVCGTHGKSSTTAMLSRILIEEGKDPSVVVGTKMKELGGRNWRRGNSNVFVVEACEYRRSFHFLSPDLVLLTTIDGDHFDAYKGIEEYREAFVEFFKLLPAGGQVIVHGGDKAALETVEKAGKKVINADLLTPPAMEVPGEHMRQNGRLAIAAALELGLGEQSVRNALEGFSGTWRRMEVVGELPNGVTVIDDYAHHPAEIHATLSAMKERYPDRRIVCVFQHHTHDRALSFYDDFVSAFEDANIVLFPDVYVARKDIEHGTLDLPMFVIDVEAHSHNDARPSGTLDQTLTLVRSMLAPGDVLVCMGAGSIQGFAQRVLSQ